MTARLQSNGFAVLGMRCWGIELGPDGRSVWTAIGTKAGPAVYCTAVDPLQNERWGDYVERSAKLAMGSIASFRWPEDATEPRTTVYFNITWADRAWFREHNHAKFSDD